jgi:tetratricopeptide (TPR) repeat protein
VEKGLLDIEAGLRGEGRLAQPLVPTASEADGSAPKNAVMGGAAASQPGPQGPGSEPSAPKVSRASQLKPDATATERALAEGLDALESQQNDVAQAKLTEAAKGLTGRALSEARVGLARIDVKTGKVQDGLQIYGEVIKVDPDYVPAWHYLGMAQMMSGDPAQAVAAWQKVVDKDPAYAKQFHLDQRIEVAKRMSGR